MVVQLVLQQFQQQPDVVRAVLVCEPGVMRATYAPVSDIGNWYLLCQQHKRAPSSVCHL